MKKNIIILLLFILISIIYTFPLILNIKSFLLGEPGDTYGVIWSMWQHKEHDRFNYSYSTYINEIASPFGYVRTSYHPVGDIIIFLFGDIFGEILGYSLLILFGFVLSAFFMYKLAFFLTKNNIAGIFSGIVFGFAPFAMAKAIAGHMVFNFVLPLYILSLFYMQKKRTIMASIIAGIAFILVSFSFLYYGYFMILFTFCFIIYDFFLIRKQKLPIKKWLLNWIIAGIIGFGVLSIHVYSFSKYSSMPKEKVVLTRPLKDLFTYSAKPWDYMLPSAYNPILGKISKPIIDSLLIGSNYAEQTLYLGIIPVLLAFYAIWLWRKKQVDIQQQNLIKYLFFTGLIMLIFSAPPFVPLGKFHIVNGEIISAHNTYFPSYLLYKIAPMFRVYARFGILVMLCTSILAGIGFACVYSRFKYYRTAFVILCFALLAFEFVSVPKFIDAKNISPVYKWLESQKGDFIIIEYPLNPDIHGLTGEYMFYQRIHKKRMFNGAFTGTTIDKLQSTMLDVTDKKTLNIIKNLGIKYIVVHRDKYAVYNKTAPEIPDVAYIKPIKSFNKDLIYKIK